MECPFELPVKKAVTHVTEAGCKYQVQIATGKRALAAFLTKDEADYIVQAINCHEKLVEALDEIEAVSCGEKQIESDGVYDDSDGLLWIYKKIQALKEKP